MSIFNEILQKREDNNIRLESEADGFLFNNKRRIRIEEEIDDAQSAVLYILQCFGIQADRLYGFNILTSLLDAMLDPLGMMYEYSEDLMRECRTRSKYILAFWEDGKAVALIPTIAGYRYFCPSDGTSGLALRKVLLHLRKDCYIFCRPIVEKNSIIGTFIANVMKSLTLGDVVKLLGATGITTLLGMVIPTVSNRIYKSYINEAGHNAMLFGWSLVIYLTVIIARSVISLIKTLILSQTKLRISMEMQSAVMAKVMHLPHSFFQQTSSGKLSSRINSCSRLSDIILDIFMDVLLNLSFSAAYLVEMRYMSPILFIPALIFIALKILVSLISSLLHMVNEKRLLDLDMEYKGFLYSAVRGIQKIKSLGAEVFIYSKWAEMYRRRLLLTYNQPFFLKYSTAIVSGVSILTTIALLGTSLTRSLAPQDYLAFISAFSLVLTVVGSLTDIMDNMFLTRFLCRNSYPLFTAETEQTEALEYIRNLRGEIKAENIYFAYDDDRIGCLSGISLHIKKGEKLAIVGESGCGKSTLLKILIGMEKPDSGTVSYDGKPLVSLNQKSLRKCIGSVFQFSRIFPGTIAENVAFGNADDPKEKKLWEALDNAEIGDYIRSLPLGLNTEVSEANSCGFSGGQRQRILLARALLDHPRVLILDEATSALDNVTQKKVLENIRKMNSTVVMVAHRLSTVRDFDRIVLLDKGRILEEGTYQELMDNEGRFARLVQKQML